MLLVLSNPALALDCTGLHPDTCAAVNAITASLNADTTVIDELSANARLRPTSIYGELNALRLAMAAADCPASPSFDGWDAGTYRPGVALGAWADLVGGASGGVSADVLGGVTGLVDDGVDVLFPVGTRYGGHNSGRQYAADRDGGYAAGRWTRIQGRNGVWSGIHATCDSDVVDDVDAWYDGALPRHATLTEHTMFVTHGPQLFGGLGAMDARCQLDADAAALEGTYLAAVTDFANGITSPDQRFPEGLELHRPDGTLIAASPVAFFDPAVVTIANPVQVRADGTMAGVLALVGGDATRGDCSSGGAFLDAASSQPTLVGNPFVTTSGRREQSSFSCAFTQNNQSIGWYCLRSE